MTAHDDLIADLEAELHNGLWWKSPKKTAAATRRAPRRKALTRAAMQAEADEQGADVA